ncbi:hypothetical protein Ddye_026522 [Dipteronia dyeriana]|uniref:DUF4283 domain-containing protein n=1 Tax=Dipteronia dyeriana TaxID=168575 RepID=A0AAD9TMW8_9ROSI|nr:hypothetical protein Ddye_026522 [Dipteronia dyeriana]
MEGDRRLGLHLVGKLLVKKLVNRDVFIKLFSTIWRMIEGVEIESLTGNTFFFTFKSASDMQQVLYRGLWSFDKALLVLEKPIGKGEIQKMSINKVSFWVQIHNIPIIYMTAVIGQFLGSLIGDVIEFDEGKLGDCVGKFIWAKVVVDVEKPLRQILRVNVMGMEPSPQCF